MNLSEYPKAIFTASIKVNEFDQKLTQIKQQMSAIEAETDLAIALNTELKNDTQRKARRTELLLEDESYQDLQQQLSLLVYSKSEALASLELLRNEFSVCKLELRRDIAQSLTSVESRELIGI